MNTEQLKLIGNVIEFPKNKNMDNKILEDKLDVTYSILKILVDKGLDFNIMISRDVALEIFDEKNKPIQDNLVLRTNKEFRLKNKNVSYYNLIGDELD